MPTQTTEAMADQPKEVALMRENFDRTTKLQDDALQALQRELSVTKALLDRYAMDLNAAKDVIAHNVSDAERGRERLNEALASAEAKQNALKEEIRKIQAEKNAAITELRRELEQAIFSANREIEKGKSLSGENDSLKRMIDEEKAKQQSLYRQLSAAQDENRTLSQRSALKTEELVKENTRLSQDYGAAKLLIKNLQEEISRQKNKVDEFSKRQVHLFVVEKTNAEKSRRIEQQEKEIKELQEKVVALCGELDALQNKLTPKKEVKTRVVYLGKE